MQGRWPQIMNFTRYKFLLPFHILMLISTRRTMSCCVDCNTPVVPGLALRLLLRSCSCLVRRAARCLVLRSKTQDCSRPLTMRTKTYCKAKTFHRKGRSNFKDHENLWHYQMAYPEAFVKNPGHNWPWHSAGTNSFSPTTEEKVAIWCGVPAQQVLITKIPTIV